MVCFPRDNKEYTADALGAWCGTRIRGVFSGDNQYAVTSNGDMTVTVSSGLGWLKMDDYWGVCAFEHNEQILSIDTADGSLPRVDVVCVRLDKNDDAGDGVVIKKGAYSPQPPTITPPVRDLDYDEIYVASIRVRAGATSIMPDDITDLRMDESYCGVMRDGVTGIPTQVLYDNFMAWFESLKDILDEEVAGHLLLMIEDLQTELQENITRIDGELAVRPYTVTTGNMTMYIATTGDDETGDGTQANPWKTLTKCFSVLPQIINHTITINVAQGQYDGENINGNGIAYSGTGSINIIASGNTSTNTTWINTRFRFLYFHFINVVLNLSYFRINRDTAARTYGLFIDRCQGGGQFRIEIFGYSASYVITYGMYFYCSRGTNAYFSVLYSVITNTSTAILVASSILVISTGRSNDPTLSTYSISYDVGAASIIYDYDTTYFANSSRSAGGTMMYSTGNLYGSAAGV